jgi:hypothetical protein
MVLPRVLGLEPLCRDCKNPLRKDCSAATPAVAVSADDVELLLLADVPAVVPPRSEINLENAVLSVVRLLDDRVEGAPAAVDVALINWLLPSSWISDVSAEVMLCCPY